MSNEVLLELIAKRREGQRRAELTGQPYQPTSPIADLDAKIGEQTGRDPNFRQFFEGGDMNQIAANTPDPVRPKRKKRAPGDEYVSTLDNPDDIRRAMWVNAYTTSNQFYEGNPEKRNYIELPQEVVQDIFGEQGVPKGLPVGFDRSRLTQEDIEWLRNRYKGR